MSLVVNRNLIRRLRRRAFHCEDNESIVSALERMNIVWSKEVWMTYPLNSQKEVAF